jgi:hypothetical protein
VGPAPAGRSPPGIPASRMPAILPSTLVSRLSANFGPWTSNFNEALPASSGFACINRKETQPNKIPLFSVRARTSVGNTTEL